MNVTIKMLNPHESELIVSHSDVSWKLRQDDVTGDWIVTSEMDESVKAEWMASKDDAIKYALEKAGVLDDANYNRPPDRTSA